MQLLALSLTLAIELAVILAARLAAGDRDRGELLRWAAIAAAASLLTHPFAWWSNDALVGRAPFWQRAAIIELSVIGAEAVIYRVGASARWPVALALAALANATSFALGLLILS